MSTELDDYRRAVLDQLADLPDRELRLARDTVDDWLAEREGDDLPPPTEYARELRSSLRADRQAATPQQRFGRWLRRRWPAVTVCVLVIGALTWWLRTDGDVHEYSGRVWSTSLPNVVIGASPFDPGVRYFYCGRGELEVDIGFNADPRATLKDVRFALMDDAWTAWVHRTRATARAEVGDTTPVPIKGFRLTTMNQVRIVYQLDRCPVQMDGGTRIEDAVIVYTMFGREHRDRVKLVVPIALTGCQVTRTTLKC